MSDISPCAECSGTNGGHYKTCSRYGGPAVLRDKERELRPCPFCGSKTPYFERLGSPRQSCIVACGNCGARHESSDEGDASGSSWNERAALDATPAEPSALEEHSTDQWWLKELEGLCGSADHLLTDDTRRAANVAVNFIHVVLAAAKGKV